MEKTMEQWKDVVGYEGFYQVSNTGKVKSVPHETTIIWNGKEVVKPIREKEIAQKKQNGGYLMANLSVGGKRRECTVHRLVAKAFIPNPNNLSEVNHIDGDKTNNSVDNLEWVSRSDNLKHRARVLGIKSNTVKVMCMDTGTVFSSIREAAAWAGVSDTAIQIALKSNGTRKGGGHRWKRLGRQS